MKDCTTCRWNFKPESYLITREKSIPCIQGHTRILISSNLIPIENCHAWAEKEKCECMKISESDFFPTFIFSMRCKKCGKVYG